MIKLYEARPLGQQRIVVAPGAKDVLVLGPRHAAEQPIQAVVEPDWNRNAPIAVFPEQFKAVMRAKGWLR